METVKFNTQDSPEFFKTLRKRVNAYFKDNGIEKTANTAMKIKTAFMLLLYFVPYTLLMTKVVPAENTLLFISMWVVMGFGIGGIGLAIMHDANHGSYSKNATVNKILGGTLNAAGGWPMNWKIQHNVLHHTYTNIADMDEDIDTGFIMRFSPHQPYHKFQRFQAFYAWLFYGIMTFYWVIAKDFIQLAQFNKKDLYKGQGITFGKALFQIIVFKILYYAFILVAPLMVLKISFGYWFLSFFIMHFIAGMILALVFQPAHVVLETEFPLPDESGSVENTWAIHQMKTTANFAPNNKILSWYVGGLNYQVEHHLFPNICHVHYPKISKIVEDTAKEFGVPYYSQPTFTSALKSHFTLLHRLGKGATA